MDVQGKHVLVVGLARSGLAVARVLARHGAIVTVSDNKPPSEFGNTLSELLKDKIGMELGAQRAETFLKNEMIVISPGVPWDLPQLKAARERGIPVYPEVEAASWFIEGPIIGITGSNGKTTTTSLLGDMLKASGFPTFVGGNIGNPLSAAADHAEAGTKFVTELSSFQLEATQDFKPHVAVMLNLSPNHLDRHPNLEAYAEAKRRIFRNQDAQDYAVLNADDAWVAALRTTVKSKPILFSRTREVPQGVFAAGGKVYYRIGHLERVLFETRDVRLKGDFNLEDVLAASAAACLVGADFAAIRKAVREFKAVEHRLEFVQEIKGVDFYNNSKATSVDATLKSLGAFDHGIHLILGGKDKGAPYTPLVPLIKERVREVLTIGAAAPIISQQLEGSTELRSAGDLETAIYEAFSRARPGDTVLLAPACSSFDQFTDYEERGRVFKSLVHQLASDVESGRNWRPKLTALPGSRIGEEAGPVAAPPGRPKAAVQSPAPEPARAEVARVTQPDPAQIAAVETPSTPAKTPEEKRLAARKRAQELASERGWNVSSTPVTEAAGESLPVETASKDDRGNEVPREASEAPTTKISVSVSESVMPAADERRSFSVAAIFDRGKPSEDVVDLSRAVDRAEGTASGKRTSAPSPSERSRDPLGSRRVELSYVYEVGAVDLPGMESQLVPEDEPVILVSAGRQAVVDDDVLPFEWRPAAPKSGKGEKAPSPRTAGRKAAKQPKLFDGGQA
jgi:UDP-N-acetylmuramoylalanine--D-glutamate ligase